MNVRTVIAVTPHPDDETLGAGGTLLRHIEEGDTVIWLIITCIAEEDGWSKEHCEERKTEIKEVAEKYGFKKVIELGFPAAKLDDISFVELVKSVSRVVSKVEPNVLYLPFPGDAHSEHSLVFKALSSTTKWFRYPSIGEVYTCEIQSETDFGINPCNVAFQPNYFVDVSSTFEKKLEIMKIFSSELGEHPFPRSLEGMEALAKLRGAACGVRYAEAFQQLKRVKR